MRTRWILALVAVAVAVAFAPRGAATAPVDRPAAEPVVVYQVKPGDTLYDLAARYLVAPSAARRVQSLNQVADPRRLLPARRLIVPASLLRSEPIVGRLTAYSGSVVVKGIGAGPVRRDMEIREGFELATGANAFLTFELPDGSRTTLPSQSRVRIERLRRVLLTGALERDLRLEDGRSSSMVTPMTEPLSRFRILTPRTVSAVRGTQFRVSHLAGADRTTVEVIEGKVGETSGPAETLVGAGFGLAAAAGRIGPVQALLAQPTLSDPSRLQDEPRLVFDLQAQPEAAAYRGQIATDAGFIDIQSEVTSQQPSLSFEGLANGTFFARFTAIDGAGLEGLPAAYAFERRLNALGLDAPSAVAGARRQYLFKWRSTGGAPETFRFVLAREAGAVPVIDEAGLVERQIVVTDLLPGAYYWRVLVSRREDGRLFEKWSPPQKFEIGG